MSYNRPGTLFRFVWHCSCCDTVIPATVFDLGEPMYCKICMEQSNHQQEMHLDQVTGVIIE